MLFSRTAQSILFVASAATWLVLALVCAPQHQGYCALFIAACLALAVATYWLPVAGWWALLALVPVADLPARALALGAHEALVFLALAFGLGWWANRIVTSRPTLLSAALAVPLIMLTATGITSGFWTALRYADFYPLGTDAFRNVWVNLAGATDAAQAVRQVLDATAKYLVVPVVFWATYSIQRETAPGKGVWRTMMTVWAWALLPVYAVMAYQSVFAPSFCMLGEPAWAAASRVSGGMSDPNALGMALFLLLPLATLQALQERGLRQVLMIAVVALGLYGVAQSGSRSALLGLLLTAGIASTALLVRARGPQERRTRNAAAIVLIVVVAIIAAPFVAPRLVMIGSAGNPLARRVAGYWNRIRQSNRAELIDRRDIQWRQAFAMWRDVPLTGVGLGAFAIEVPNYNRAAAIETPVDNAWNQYFQWLSEIGALGLFFWLWFIGAALRRAVGDLRGRAAPATVTEVVVSATLAALLLLNIVGTHLHAAEVACVAAVLAAVGLAGLAGPGAAHEMLTRPHLAGVALAAVLVCAAQAYTASGPLGRATLERRFGLPAEFGLYRVERWQSSFPFQWAQKYAGKGVVVPDGSRVMTLRVMALDPDLSPDNPKRVKVWINGRFLDTLVLSTAEWQEHDVYVYDAAAGPATVTFECDRVWNPPNETPPRTLGIALACAVAWRSDLRHEGQNLSPWYWDGSGTNAVHYRWTGQRVARMITVGPEGVVVLKLRAPATTPFYREPVQVKVYFNDMLLSTIAMPRDNRTWVACRFAGNAGIQERKGILWLEVSRLTRVRMPGTVRRINVGVAMAEIQTE